VNFAHSEPFGDEHIRDYMLGNLTTHRIVVKISNMKAKQLVKQRVEIHDTAFAELVIWQLPQPLAGSQHTFKYRLAYVVDGQCVLRYDNEAGKGDHRHCGQHEAVYKFTTPRQLAADFFNDVERYNHEHTND
jgi:hypothetical protein